MSLPCFIFAISDEDRPSSTMHECETDYDTERAIRDLIHQGYLVDNILWVPMDHARHVGIALSNKYFDRTKL